MPLNEGTAQGKTRPAEPTVAAQPLAAHPRHNSTWHRAGLTRRLHAGSLSAPTGIECLPGLGYPSLQRCLPGPHLV
jgi:hypothetical protein